MPTKPNTLKDFDALVDRSAGPTACWPWTGYCAPSGYGRFRLNHKQHQAHVIALIRDTVRPPGLFVLHSCDNRRCCNPAHLRLGTHDANMKDMTARDRSCSKYPVELVERVIEFYRSHDLTYRDVGEHFGIPLHTVYGWCRLVTRSHSLQVARNERGSTTHSSVPCSGLPGGVQPLAARDRAGFDTPDRHERNG